MIPIDSYEVVEIEGENITVDLLVWRRYRCRTRGVIEAMLTINPYVAKQHRDSPFLPVGMLVIIPISLSQLQNRPRPIRRDVLWAEAKGYRL